MGWRGGNYQGFLDSCPLSTLRRALSGKQRPETAELLHALQVLEKRGYGVLEPMEYRGQQGWKYTASKPLLMAS